MPLSFDEKPLGYARNRQITNIAPWPKGALVRAYKRTNQERWSRIEDAAIKAQGKPDLND